MRRWGVVPALAAALLCQVASGAVLLTDFSAETPRLVSMNRPNTDRLHVQAAGNGSGPVLSWDASPPSLEAVFDRKSPMRIPAFEKAYFQLEIEVPAEIRLNVFNFRLLDATNEAFQYRLTFEKPLSPGIHKLTFPVALKHDNAWGGNNDRKLDFPVMFYGVALDFPGNAPAGKIILRNLSYAVEGEACSFRLSGGNAWNVLSVGKRAGISVRNDGTADAGLTGTVRLRSMFSGTREYPVKWHIPAGETIEWLFPEPFLKQELYLVDTDLRSAAGKSYAATFRFACMNPAGAEKTLPGAGDFLFGICTHSNRFTPAEQLLEAKAAAFCGAQFARIDFAWNAIQPNGENEFEIAALDRLVKFYEAEGISVQPLLGYAPSWPCGGREAGLPEGVPSHAAWPDPERYAAFCGRVARHFKGRLRYYEIWNEPDLFHFAAFPARKYMALLTAAFDRIKAADPDAAVMNGGIAASYTNSSENPGHNNGLLTLLAADGGAHYDYFAFHGHGSWEEFAGQLAELRKLRLACPGAARPWLANETAINSLYVGELRQAETLVKKLLYAWSLGAAGYNWYQLREGPGDADEYGLLTPAFEPRAAYLSYNMLAGLLRKGRFRKSLDLGGDVMALQFSLRGGECLTALWRKSGASLEMFRSGRGEKVEIVDLFGNPLPSGGDSGEFCVALSERPLLLRSRKELRYVGRVFTAPGRLTLKRDGAETGVTFPLCNPGNSPLAGQLKIAAGPELRIVGDQLRAFTVPAGGWCEVSFRIAATSAFRSVGGKMPVLRLAPQIAHGGVAEEFPISCVLARTGFEADFTLGGSGQYLRLIPDAPGQEKYLYGGAADLSAEIYLWRTASSAWIKVVVTDDIHDQNHPPVDLWKGDSVQLHLIPPTRNGIWSLGMARGQTGSDDRLYAWSSPMPEEALKRFRLTTARDTERKVTTYLLEMPLDALGISDRELEQGIRFNLIVNDSDYALREGFLYLAPGLGAGEYLPENYPLVTFPLRD